MVNKKILKICEKLGWTVDVQDDESVNLQKFSPEEHDFNVEIECDNIDIMLESLQEKIDNYDISYETYIWLDNTGHGTNGSPYDMRDLYNDFEKCLEMMKELYTKLCEYYKNEN